ncbi:restriction endonuclease subunit S [Thermoflavifilum sp.]
MKSDFEKFAIPLPTLPEQQKIADCLSACWMSR